MRIQTLQVFDQFINGTGTTWYSGSQYNDVIARADFFAIQGCATSVTAGALLTVWRDISADGENWLPGYASTPEIQNAAISTTPTAAGYFYPAGVVPTPGYARLAITLGGTSPQCRLKLYVTLRSRG